MKDRIGGEDILPAQLLVDKQGWNEYWNKKNGGGRLYALIAEFYRKCIIRPSLNHFTGKYFPPGGNLLHAGCGSGQVDKDIRHRFAITGLDISPAALKIYERENEGLCKSLQGSIFATGLSAGSLDGIYNLGVMEHFSHEEIHKILVEFHRILKPHGKLVIFWPPVYGMSVIFFKILRGAIGLLFNREVKFHPDEVSQIRSVKQARELFSSAGFRVVDYAFGLRDLFTYAVIVAEKRETT